MLKFDKNGLGNEILNKLEVELQWAFQAWEGEVVSRLKYGEFAKNSDLDYSVKKIENNLVAYLKANTYVLADSYGTGSLMLEDNPGLQDYKNNKGNGKGQWNPMRTSNAIMGRSRGEYTDLFGNKRRTEGSFEASNIEGWRMNTGYRIEPVSPSYALQDAEKALYGTYLRAAYKNAIRNVNFAKFLIES